MSKDLRMLARRGARVLLFSAMLCCLYAPASSQAYNYASAEAGYWIDDARTGYQSVSASGLGPPAFNVSVKRASTSIDGAPYFSVTSGEFMANVESDVDGGPGTRTTSASTTINDLSMVIGDPLAPLFTLSASQMGALLFATGSPPVPGFGFEMTSNDVQATYRGQQLDFPTKLENSYYLVFDPVGGLIVQLNLFEPGYGYAPSWFAAMYIRMYGQEGLTGEMWIAATSVEMTTVPEPSTFACLFVFCVIALGSSNMERTRRALLNFG